jgi:hypothetical protein
MYRVELLCEWLPQLSKRQLLDSLKKRCPMIEPFDGSVDSEFLAFIHPDHLTEDEGIEGCASVFIYALDKIPDMEELSRAKEQSWGFSGTMEQVQNCTASILVFDSLTKGLDYKTRLALFQKALTSVLEMVSCQAIYWEPTQQLLDPLLYLSEVASEIYPDILAGAFNIRQFRFINEESQKESLMDTLGLAALGLPDLQCHFRNLEIPAVAKILFDLGMHLFENGDVIEDGHTIAGINPEDTWLCQRGTSLIDPERVVLDVHPGYPFAVRNRM